MRCDPEVSPSTTFFVALMVLLLDLNFLVLAFFLSNYHQPVSVTSYGQVDYSESLFVNDTIRNSLSIGTHTI